VKPGAGGARQPGQRHSVAASMRMTATTTRTTRSQEQASTAWPGRLNERHPASWKLWLQDLALDSLETSAGLSGGGLALLCFPMSVRKEVYAEPRGHRQPGWPGVVRSGGGRDG
jgi:hypothetical protein